MKALKSVLLSAFLAGLSMLAVDMPSAQPVAPTRPAATSTAPQGKNYKVAARPRWVVEPPRRETAASGAAARANLRYVLADFQANYTQPRPVLYMRLQLAATDAANVGEISQHRIVFNPAYQSVTIHTLSVTRNGVPGDRLKDAQIELIRREARLEASAIDGLETLLVVPKDVRAGDTVEVSYSIDGENPIFNQKISLLMSLGFPVPADLLHVRVTAPAGRTLRARTVATDVEPERFTEGTSQVVRIVRTGVEGIPWEDNVPPWVKVYPALQLTEYPDWKAVDAWASTLFSVPPQKGAEYAALLTEFRKSGLSGAALADKVLTFVQDDIRYFSVSLGENSHRPKAPQQTLIDRVGDCKDKVLLLTSLLTDLGFDVKPALVSIQRNRGIESMLPSHDQFDHAVARLRLDGRTYFIDATLGNQGTTLATRGSVDYGRALVVGEGAALEVVPRSENARFEFEQRWDYSTPGKGVELTTVLTAGGLLAEELRNRSAKGLDRDLGEALSSTYVRLMPTLTQSGSAVIDDDRSQNVFKIVQAFQTRDAGAYSNGALQVEFAPVELADLLTGPPEARRRFPFLLAQPRSSALIAVKTPNALDLRVPAPVEIVDRHFRLTQRVDLVQPGITFSYRLDRLADEVAPADVEVFRSNLLRARQQAGSRLSISLADPGTVRAEADRISKRLTTARGFKDDRLTVLLFQNELRREIDGLVLQRLEANPGPLKARVHASRATASNMLGDFADGLKNADAALQIDSKSDEALDARGVALIGLNRLDEAYSVFEGASKGADRSSALQWMGTIRVLQGRHADAEAHLRQAVEQGGGEGREFALLWLFIAAEGRNGSGTATVQQQLDKADPKRLPGALLLHLAGRLSRDELLKVASDSTSMERLNLAEVYFYTGQKLLVQGRKDEAAGWFKRTIETGATPYREVTFAKLQLAGV